VIVEGGTLRLEAAGQMRAQVTFTCDTETFLLLMWGRLALETATATGQISIEGDHGLAADFGRWYKGF
jgi:putative sterol carrier protein